MAYASPWLVGAVRANKGYESLLFKYDAVELLAICGMLYADDKKLIAELSTDRTVPIKDVARFDTAATSDLFVILVVSSSCMML